MNTIQRIFYPIIFGCQRQSDHPHKGDHLQPMQTGIILVFLSFFLFPKAAWAQSIPFTAGQALGASDSTSVALGDVDGDGDLDAFVGTDRQRQQSIPDSIYINQGGHQEGIPGSFVDSGQRLHDGATNAVALGDLDGDGDLDAVISTNAGNFIYINADGNFQKSEQPLNHQWSRTVALGDVDGDGDLDAFISMYIYVDNVYATHVYRNQGGIQGGAPGTFGEESEQLGTANGYGIALGDLDNDGDLDAFIGNESTPNQVYLNQGGVQQGRQGLFRDSGQKLGDAHSKAVALGDVDGDGDLDAIVANERIYVYNEDNIGELAGEQENRLYLNQGGRQGGNLGHFQESEQGLDTVESKGDSRAVALTDLDGDGDLDALVANRFSNRVYINQGGEQQGTRGHFSVSSIRLGSADSYDVAVGDLDGDGDTDAFVSNSDGQADKIWLNHRKLLSDSGQRLGLAASESVVLGDIDGDGDLDALVGNNGEPNQLYINQGNHQQGTLGTFQESGQDLGNAKTYYAVALGDLDMDGDLDAFIGNYDVPNQVYINQGEAQAGRPGAFRESEQQIGNFKTFAVALGDVDNDGDLDALVGNSDQPNLVYLNQGGIQAGTVGVLQDSGQVLGTTDTRAIALGDLDDDGDLDALIANWGSGGAPNQIYLNQGGQQRGKLGFFQESEQTLGNSYSTSVALGDVDGDGDLDAFVGNSWSQADRIYLNQNGLLQDSGQMLGDRSTSAVALADLDNDGDLDAFVSSGPGQLYINQGGAQGGTQGIFLDSDHLFSSYVNAVALGDLDLDGDVDAFMVHGRGMQIRDQIFFNQTNNVQALLPNNPAFLTVHRPIRAAITNDYVPSQLMTSNQIPLTYTLFDAESDPISHVEAFYSLNGGGQWFPGRATADTQISYLATSPYPNVTITNTHVYTWDTFASGFFGQSENVTIRMVVYSQPLAGSKTISKTFIYTNSLPAPVQRPYASAVTFPFRVRGTQVRVLTEKGEPLEGAYVYRLDTNRTLRAQPIVDEAGNPFSTDASGYLRGRGQFAIGDQIVALLPMTPTASISFTNQYAYYLTSAKPITTGLEMQEVSATGLITLTIPTVNGPAPPNPLLLFDLTISLEWDASEDIAFLLALEEALQRASDLLYDVTDGQVAIGRVEVFHAKAFWNRADIIIHATNNMRPAAAIGGIVNRPVAETVRPAFGEAPTKVVRAAYAPGQIRMGVAWDPFGENTTDLDEQWWRALAHELGHHLLFLPDNYMGLKLSDPANPTSKRFLGRVNCKGSFMTTTYDPGYTEFLNQEQWLGECEDTLAELTTDRADWETILRFYPMLQPPAQPLEGPTNFPLSITGLASWPLHDSRVQLPTRNFELRDVDRNRQRLPTAQVYLFQEQGNDDPNDDVLIALGSPTAGGDRVKVRGAQPGDRLCLYDFGAADGQTYSSCIDDLSVADVSLPVRALDPPTAGLRWNPTIVVNAITTRTLVITVTQALEDDIPLQLQVFPAHYPATPGIAPKMVMTSTGNLHHAQVQLLYPATDVSIWIGADDESRRQAVGQFNVSLPWKAGDQMMAGPDRPAVGGPDRPAVGGPDHPAVGGPDRPVVGGPDRPAVGGPDRPAVGGPDRPAVGGPDRPAVGGPNQQYEFFAPLRSADAQVVIYNPRGLFEPSGIERLQILPLAPKLQDAPWLVPVGQAYYVQPQVTLTETRAIALHYLQRDVPAGYEHTLAIYYLSDVGGDWQRLPTQQFVENMVVADLESEPGIYVIMATVILPDLAPGWNLFAYPLPDARPICSALASIQDRYSDLQQMGADGEFHTGVEILQFGHLYRIKIEGEQPVSLQLAPPQRLPDGTLIPPSSTPQEDCF